MADVLFDQALEVVADGGWGVLTVGLFAAGGWTPDPTNDNVVADATLAGASEVGVGGYGRLNYVIGSITFDNPGHQVVFDTDTLDFGTPDSGGDYDWLIVATQGSDDTDARLVFAIDLGGSTTDGDPLSFNPDPAGILSLQKA